jgi:hypothetical protein
MRYQLLSLLRAPPHKFMLATLLMQAQPLLLLPTFLRRLHIQVLLMDHLMDLQLAAIIRIRKLID